MPKSFLVVRATVADPAKRDAFDTWYRDEHLRWAVKTFGAEKGWRFWSDTDPSVHQAAYQFAERAAAERATDLKSEGMKALVAHFDRDWPALPNAEDFHAGGRMRVSGGRHRKPNSPRPLVPAKSRKETQDNTDYAPAETCDAPDESPWPVFASISPCRRRRAAWPRQADIAAGDVGLSSSPSHSLTRSRRFSPRPRGTFILAMRPAWSLPDAG